MMSKILLGGLLAFAVTNAFATDKIRQLRDGELTSFDLDSEIVKEITLDEGDVVVKPNTGTTIVFKSKKKKDGGIARSPIIIYTCITMSYDCSTDSGGTTTCTEVCTEHRCTSGAGLMQALGW